jgi:hypothetical protein
LLQCNGTSLFGTDELSLLVQEGVSERVAGFDRNRTDIVLFVAYDYCRIRELALGHSSRSFPTNRVSVPMC